MLILSRHDIGDLLKKEGLDKRSLAAAFVIMLLFISVEAILVKPTQQLYFDDEIYQNMAQNILHSGVAWWCNYGNGSRCLATQIFHEPGGESFDLAIGFAILGITRSAAYATQLVTSALAVLLTFFAALLLFRNKKAALFSELFMALSPIMLVWAFPTTSDMPALMYSLLAFFAMLAAIRLRRARVLAFFLFAILLAVYMKVDEIVILPVFLLAYILLSEQFEHESGRNRMGSGRLFYPVLAVCIFVLLLIPEMIFINYNAGDSYGATGTSIPLTCNSNSSYMTANGMISIEDFKANICSNLFFWLGKYRSQDVIQPLIYTLFALLGAAGLLLRRRFSEFGALLVWFGALFLFYTAFYAGGVTYGVDWRFMLSLAAQAAMLGGFACAEMYDMADYYAKRLAKNAKAVRIVNVVVLAAIIVLLFTPIYLLMPRIAVNPSAIQQAGDARFDENFVYNSSSAIPNNCLVYSYDPTLFQIVGKNSTQIGNLYNDTQVAQYQQANKCLVLDYGYWCYTPNNECSYAQQSYNLVPITTATYSAMGRTYGFYYIYKK
jgi:hypothetical protein